MRIFKYLISVSTLLLVAISLSAQPMHHEGGGDGKGEGMGKHKIWQELGLNEDQRSKIKALHEGMKEKRATDRETMKNVKKKIKEELLKDKPNRSTLTSLSKEVADLTFKKTEAWADHLLKVKEILTPEQFKKMTDLHDKKREQMKKGKGHGKHKHSKECKH